MMQVYCIGKVSSQTRHSIITQEYLTRTHNIKLNAAKRMQTITAQKDIRTAIHSLHKRGRVDHLDLYHKDLKGKWYADWLQAKTKSSTQ